MALKVLAIALAIAVFAVALLPGGVALPVNPCDATQHGLAFVTLTFVLRMAWPGVAWIHHFALMAALGGAIELAQLVPALHRDASIGDWLVDVMASLGTLAILRLARRSRDVCVSAVWLSPARVNGSNGVGGLLACREACVKGFDVDRPRSHAKIVG